MPRARTGRMLPESPVPLGAPLPGRPGEGTPPSEPGEAQVGGEGGVVLHLHAAGAGGLRRCRRRVRVMLVPLAPVVSTRPISPPESVTPRSTWSSQPARRRRQFALELLDLVGLEHQARAVAELAQAALAGELLDLFLALAEGGLGLLQRVEHLGHHGAVLLVVAMGSKLPSIVSLPVRPANGWSPNYRHHSPAGRSHIRTPSWRPGLDCGLRGVLAAGPAGCQGSGARSGTGPSWSARLDGGVHDRDPPSCTLTRCSTSRGSGCVFQLRQLPVLPEVPGGDKPQLLLPRRTGRRTSVWPSMSMR